MLTGPTGGNDYFSNDHFAGSFPTPNESSLRSGLTPGGGGSMFPQPSPNSQAIFNAIQSGGATPGTLDFHRTAMHARAASQGNTYVMPQPTSQPQDPNIQPNLDSKGFGPQRENDAFEQHDANDAANGLYLLAQARGGNRNQPQQYPPPHQQPQMNYMGNNSHMSNQMAAQRSHENSPHMANRAANKNSVASNMSGSTQNEQGDFSESGHSEDAKPQARGRGKKGAPVKAPANGRRKAEDTPAKGANKRQKSNHGSANLSMPEDEMDSDDDDENKLGADGKKMTDEEKRKNFLERNRYGDVFFSNPWITTDLRTGSRHSNVVNARSSGLRICNRKLRYSRQKMTLLLPRLRNFVRRLWDSRRFFLRTRNVRYPKHRVSVVWQCKTLLVSHISLPIHTA